MKRLVVAKPIEYNYKDKNKYLEENDIFYAMFTMQELNNGDYFEIKMPDLMCNWWDTSELDFILLEIDSDNWVTDIYPEV